MVPAWGTRSHSIPVCWLLWEWVPTRSSIPCGGSIHGAVHWGEGLGGLEGMMPLVSMAHGDAGGAVGITCAQMTDPTAACFCSGRSPGHPRLCASLAGGKAWQSCCAGEGCGYMVWLEPGVCATPPWHEELLPILCFWGEAAACTPGPALLHPPPGRTPWGAPICGASPQPLGPAHRCLLPLCLRLRQRQGAQREALQDPQAGQRRLLHHLPHPVQQPAAARGLLLQWVVTWGPHGVCGTPWVLCLPSLQDRCWWEASMGLGDPKPVEGDAGEKLVGV